MARGSNQVGDFTGKERERLARENADEIAKRQKEIGLVNEIQANVEDAGVYDPTTQEVLEAPPGTEEALEQVIFVHDEDEVVDASTDASATLREQPMDPFKNVQPIVTQQAPKPEKQNPYELRDEPTAVATDVLEVEAPTRVIRAAADLEEFTYGVGNTYTLVAGRRYRLPKDVADWLDDKGFVDHRR